MVKDHILYIDDEKENLTGFKYVFKKHFNVHIAGNKDEGWAILKNHPVKVLITDQRMPKMTGVEILERSAKEFPNVYRIILTGYTDVQDIIAAINKGKIFQFIRKPWDKEEVKIILDNAIKLFDLQSENQNLIRSLQDSNEQLQDVNYRLEKLVESRTLKIEKQNKELEKHQNHLEELVRQRTRELELAKQKAEESDKLKSSFLANVSHEIRTPMNAIIGFSELLLTEDYSKDEKKEFRDQVLINSNYLLRLIDDIIDISIIEANQIKINYGEHSIKSIIDELIMVFNKQIQEHESDKIDIIIDDSEPEDITVLTDKVRLHQVLSNLIGNAIKFAEQGEIHIGYKLVENSSSNHMIQFYVQDDGIGISKDDQIHIFERFRKVSDSDQKIYRGTGLGLFICRSVVNKFGGNIWVESELGKGSTFYFDIPYKPVENITDEVLNESNLSIDSDSFNFNGKTIIVAEDEDSSYYFIENAMRYTNANLKRARNGQETLDLIKSTEKVDLILMDLQMPVMNGYTAISTIKEKKYKIPIIAQTAYALVEQREKIINSGCDDFLPKPYKTIELLNTVKKHLNKNTTK